jgi:2-succinyl-5-enolpyruvyl-6-hydroxy-3-cyclohexene-1-carboxylate synthase
MATDRLNQRWAAHLVGALVAGGMRSAVVAPGSRSTPLALALAERTDVKTYALLDERVAGFFALGLAKAQQRPVVVVCTSGTAGAHFLPAVMEAASSGTPLVVLTADRPWELHGFGAPQTVDQSTLFSRFTRTTEMLSAPLDSPEALTHLTAVVARAVSLSIGASRGPVHLNVPFREPLAPTDGSPGEVVQVRPTRFFEQRGLADLAMVREALESSSRCLVVCGPRERFDGFGEAVHRLAWRWGMPVLAEAASNARYGYPEAVGLADAMLRNSHFADAMRPEVVLRFGLGLTAKGPQAWLDASGARVFAFSDDGLAFDPQHRAEAVFACDVVATCRALAEGLPRQTPYRESWLRTEQLVEGRLAALSTELDEPHTARVLVGALPADTNLVVSSSMPIRDVDAFAPRAIGPLRVFANRGLNGIDGVVATALGVAAASPEQRTVLLIGDVAALHDVGSFVAARVLGVPFTVVVVNNDGGGIFSFLPVAERTRHFESLFGMPHHLDFADVAQLASGQLHRPVDLNSLRRALAAAFEGGLHLIEVQTDRKANVEAHRRIFAQLASAVAVAHDSSRGTV